MKKSIYKNLNNKIKRRCIIPVITLLVYNLITLFNMEVLRLLLTNYYDKNKFMSYFIIIIISYLISFVLFHVVNYTSNKAEKNIVTDYKISLLKKNALLKNIDLNSFSREDRFLTGEEDVLKHTNQILKCITIINDFIMIPFYVFYGFYINPLITILTILVTIIVGLINVRYTKNYSSSVEEYYNSWDSWSNMLFKSMENISLIRIFLSKIKIIDSITQRNITLKKSQVDSLKAYLDICRIKESFEIIFNTFIIICSFILIKFNKIVLADIVILIQLLNIIEAKVFMIPEMTADLRLLKSTSKRINEYLQLEEEDFDNQISDSQISDSINTIELNSVSVSFNNEVLLDNLSYTFKKGNLYFVIGESGCGKSTLLKGISKMINLNGNFLINGTSASFYTRNDLTKKIEYVNQSPVFINDTIKNNILCNKNYDKDTYNTLIEQCALDKVFIKNNISDEYEIMQDGSPLSSGERQLLAFIRAVYQNKDVYLFDEITSAVDLENECLIVDYLRKLAKRDKIVILITHRTNCIKSTDNVIELKNTKRGKNEE